MIPVLWVSRHDEILARGYWDQALIETIFDRSLWDPVDGFEFEHHEVRGDFPEIEGAVVVLPARHHVNDVDWLNGQLAKLDWCVLMLLGDEEWDFPWARVLRDNQKVWVMQAKPEHADVSERIPCGFYPQSRELIAPNVQEMLLKPLDWMFAGQDTNSRRNELIAVLKQMSNGSLVATQGYLHGAVNDLGLSREQYAQTLASAKVIPCPSGPKSVCTARVEEALEAGAIPVLDMRKPEDPQYDYWKLTFGEHPLPTIQSWQDFPDVLQAQLDGWPANINKMSSWWQQYKRNLVYKLEEDIQSAGGPSKVGSHLLDGVTVVVTTSPSSFHPSISDIKKTLRSIRNEMPTVEIIIVADGVRPEQEHLTEDYEEYLRRLYLATNRMHNVLLVRTGEWMHQANATRAAMEFVKTPYVFFCEHDTPIQGPIPWEDMCNVIGSGIANVIRLHFDVAIHPEHEVVMFDHVTQWINGVPMRRTKAWWQRPHLALSSFYREKILSVFATSSRTMIEDVVYGMMSAECEKHGLEGWENWKVWMYTPNGNMQRSSHLDTRGPDNKYGMVFEYAGEKPPGAPTDSPEARNFITPGKPR